MTEKIYKVSVEYGPSINALEGFGCFGAGDYASGEMWITQEAMDGLRELHGDIEVFEERDMVPVWHSPMRYLETRKLEGIMNCIVMSEWEDSWEYEEDVVELFGICFLGNVVEGIPLPVFRHAFLLGPSSQKFIWLALCCEQDIEFAKSVYRGNPEFERWLAEVTATHRFFGGEAGEQ